MDAARQEDPRDDRRRDSAHAEAESEEARLEEGSEGARRWSSRNRPSPRSRSLLGRGWQPGADRVYRGPTRARCGDDCPVVCVGRRHGAALASRRARLSPGPASRLRARDLGLGGPTRRRSRRRRMDDGERSRRAAAHAALIARSTRPRHQPLVSCPKGPREASYPRCSSSFDVLARATPSRSSARVYLNAEPVACSPAAKDIGAVLGEPRAYERLFTA